MSSSLLTRFRRTLLIGALLLSGLPGLALAAYSSADFSSLPLTADQNASNAKPLIMLLLSKDDSLYKKAYTDLVDLTGDGFPNTTYTDSVTYYGYFTPTDCYTYDATNNYYTPSIAASGTNDHTCSPTGTYWSGNFLNWASMTRLDVVRKVLYGGYRSTDTSSKTVLERSYIPTDAHSFAKVYTPANSSDPSIDELTPFSPSTGYITLCNTTDTTSGKYSQNVTDPPLLRVADGNFSKWASNERWQCTWDKEKSGYPKTYTADAAGDNVVDESTSGLTGGANGSADYYARVEVCGANLLNASNCTKYTDSSGNSDFKPTGLLQTYGASGKVDFGLITGSYVKSRSGGVLRKNISDFSNEVNAGDGTFKTNVDGIVSTLDALRVHGYNTNDGRYSDNSSSGDSCNWGLSDAATEFPEPDCSNWGNPVSEMYLEAVRYFDGLKPDTDFSSATNSDSTWIPGVNGVPALNTASWKSPLNSNNWCAKCAIIVMNSGPFSYDSDQIDNGFSDLKSGTTAEALTDQIGTWEGITGSDYFIGDNGTLSTNTGLCTAKTISSLSLALGPCPDLPRLGGSYDIAGIAYWAHVNNLNPSAPNDSPQTITTYSVSLSATTPIIKIPVPGNSTQKVKLIPACRNTGTATASDCRIVDLQITKPYTLDTTSNTATGEIYVNWEDSEQGGDYDQDMRGTISYKITGTTIAVTTYVGYDSTNYSMGFGYIINGTTNDGYHVTSGIYNYKYTDASISNSCGSTSNPSCVTGATATTVTYTLGTTNAGILQDPLWYAAKYGGFLKDKNSKLINSTSQWDSNINSTNASGSDGIPDNYFNSTNPGQLAVHLNQVLASITAQVSSGTSAAVVANAGSGAGMIVQAYYQPKYTSTATATNASEDVTWVGDVYSLFVDSQNRLREDNGNTAGQLDSGDDAVSIVYKNGETQIKTYNPTTSSPSKATLDSFNTLKPIWSARDELAKIASSAITVNRSYGAAIGSNMVNNQYTTGRYIFTSIPQGSDTFLHNPDVVGFDTTDIDSSNYNWLDIQTDFNGDGKIDVNDAHDLINYIRGKEGIDNFRSRTITYNGKKIVWRLGDIIHSTPLIVGPPDADYANRYGDTSYQAYMKHYQHRRVMVYAGANDGMLHAFNAGFYDSKFQAYCTQPPDTTSESSACSSSVSGNYIDDPLGTELWAYVPNNLLPQLQWLPEQNYPHVYYVDGSPKAFDVNIFKSGIDTTTKIDHPDGWGTILVVGMRLGGGEMDHTLPDGTAVKAHSAYMIFDITDPEHKPVLLGEINAKNLGFTTSTPSIMVRRAPDSANDWTNPNPNDWYLVFGSGPTDLNTVTSTQNARLYALNLNDLGNNTSTPGVNYATGYGPYVLGAANSFVGDVNSIDWTNNFKTDAAYFGIAGGTPASPTGQLMRLVLSGDTGTNWSPSTVIDPGQPFINPPQFAIDEQNNWWVYDGTGRLYVDADGTSQQTQSYYGIKEPVSNGALAGTAVTTSDLQQTTGVLVGTDSSNTLYDPLGVLPNGVNTFDQLQTDIAGKSGWYINFPNDPNTTTTGTPRNLGTSTLFSQLMLFTTFAPNNNSCTFNGSSRLYAVYYKTGTAYPNAGLDNRKCSTCGTGVDVTPPSTALDGSVITGGVTIGVGANTNFYTTDTKGVGTPTPVKGVPTPTGRQSWREIIPQ